jgi:hypothetical protein
MSELRSLADDIRRFRSDSTSPAYGEHIDEFSKAVGLDDSVLGMAHRHELGNGSSPVSMTREPVHVGMGSFWLSQITLAMDDGSELMLMEKAVDATGPEAQFWASAAVRNYQLAGRHFTSIAPLFSIDAEPLTVLYLPYFEVVHRTQPENKRNFRSDLGVLVRAVAEFNASNLVPASEAAPEERRIVATRKDAPSIRDIQKGLGVQSRHAAQLLRAACQHIDTRWDELREMYDATPAGLCHNDIGPGNAIVDSASEHVHLLDFEKAGVAPIGSDMHTILRWGGRSLEHEDEAERLLSLYAEQVQRLRPEVTLSQVRVGAWVTFFMRYSSIGKWRSARNLDSYSLALLKAAELLDETA